MKEMQVSQRSGPSGKGYLLLLLIITTENQTYNRALVIRDGKWDQQDTSKPY